MKKDFVVTGLHYGEHGFVPEEIISEVEKYGKDCKLVMIRPKNGVEVTHEQCCEWARYFKEHEIYFCFLYSVDWTDGVPKSIFTKETVEEMYELAGEYFLGDALGEMGNGLGAQVYDWHGEENVRFKNLTEARDQFVRDVKSFVDANRAVGIKNVGVVESHTMIKYDFQGGVDIGYAELLLGNPEHILSFERGATRGRGKEEFGGYIAHEWYGGVRHNDPLKYKRFPLIYRTAYMEGASKIFLESGFEATSSYGYSGGEDDPYCCMVREEVEKFNKFVSQDERPAGGPKVKVAFVSGYLDGYAGNGIASGGVRAAVWGQRGREEWSKNAPEHSFYILDEVYRSRDWHNPINYGDYDYSGAPGYGLYDVLPIESSVEAMKRYDWLIFTGWNTMTEENYAKIKEFVRCGGNVLISAAHLKTGDVRGVDSPYIHDGKLEDFLGCNLTQSKFRSNKSYKFARESIAKNVFFPGPADHTKDMIDPIGSNGYATYVEIEEKGCRKTIYLSKTFTSTEIDYKTHAPVMVENSYGDGKVLFMCTDEYPGAMGVYTLYSIIVKAILNSTHMNADVKVIAGDKVRFAVYESDEIYKVYLLNTDMNLEQKALVIYGDEKIETSVASTELASVVIKK